MNRIRIEKGWRPALALILWTGVAAGAHSGDRAYPIPYLSDEVLEQIQLHDSRVDEWMELVGEPTMTSLDFTTGFGRLPPDPSDLDFRIWLAWHDDPARLYAGFVSSDDIYKNNHEYDAPPQSLRHVMYLNDSISLAIDGDHSGGEGCSGDCPEEDWVDIHEETQYYEAIAHTASGPTLDCPVVRYFNEDGAFAWTAIPPYGEGGGGVAGEAPVISVIELYVTPFDRLVGDNIQESVTGDLSAGQVIGFAIAVHDNEGDGWRPWTPEGMQRSDSYAEFDIMSLRADYFLDGILLPPEPEGSAVESDSWGRIKASLELE